MMLIKMMMMMICDDAHLFSDFSFRQMNPSHPNREQYSELYTKAKKSHFMHCVFSYLLQA